MWKVNELVNVKHRTRTRQPRAVQVGAGTAGGVRAERGPPRQGPAHSMPSGTPPLSCGSRTRKYTSTENKDGNKRIKGGDFLKY